MYYLAYCQAGTTVPTVDPAEMEQATEQLRLTSESLKNKKNNSLRRPAPPPPPRPSSAALEYYRGSSRPTTSSALFRHNQQSSNYAPPQFSLDDERRPVSSRCWLRRSIQSGASAVHSGVAPRHSATSLFSFTGGPVASSTSTPSLATKSGFTCGLCLAKFGSKVKRPGEDDDDDDDGRSGGGAGARGGKGGARRRSSPRAAGGSRAAMEAEAASAAAVPGGGGAGAGRNAGDGDGGGGVQLGVSAGGPGGTGRPVNARKSAYERSLGGEIDLAAKPAALVSVRAVVALRAQFLNRPENLIGGGGGGSGSSPPAGGGAASSSPPLSPSAATSSSSPTTMPVLMLGTSGDGADADAADLHAMGVYGRELGATGSGRRVATYSGKPNVSRFEDRRAARAAIQHGYETVAICRFCAQFFGVYLGEPYGDEEEAIQPFYHHHHHHQHQHRGGRVNRQHLETNQQLEHADKMMNHLVGGGGTQQQQQRAGDGSFRAGDGHRSRRSSSSSARLLNGRRRPSAHQQQQQNNPHHRLSLDDSLVMARSVDLDRTGAAFQIVQSASEIMFGPPGGWGAAVVATAPATPSHRGGGAGTDVAGSGDRNNNNMDASSHHEGHQEDPFDHLSPIARDLLFAGKQHSKQKPDGSKKRQMASSSSSVKRNECHDSAGSPTSPSGGTRRGTAPFSGSHLRGDDTSDEIEDEDANERNILEVEHGTSPGGGAAGYYYTGPTHTRTRANAHIMSLKRRAEAIGDTALQDAMMMRKRREHLRDKVLGKNKKKGTTCDDDADDDDAASLLRKESADAGHRPDEEDEEEHNFSFVIDERPNDEEVDDDDDDGKHFINQKASSSSSMSKREFGTNLTNNQQHQSAGDRQKFTPAPPPPMHSLSQAGHEAVPQPPPLPPTHTISSFAIISAALSNCIVPTCVSAILPKLLDASVVECSRVCRLDLAREFELAAAAAAATTAAGTTSATDNLLCTARQFQALWKQKCITGNSNNNSDDSNSTDDHQTAPSSSKKPLRPLHVVWILASCRIAAAPSCCAGTVEHFMRHSDRQQQQSHQHHKSKGSSSSRPSSARSGPSSRCGSARLSSSTAVDDGAENSSCCFGVVVDGLPPSSALTNNTSSSFCLSCALMRVAAEAAANGADVCFVLDCGLSLKKLRALWRHTVLRFSNVWLVSAAAADASSKLMRHRDDQDDEEEEDNHVSAIGSVSASAMLLPGTYSTSSSASGVSAPPNTTISASSARSSPLLALQQLFSALTSSPAVSSLQGEEAQQPSAASIATVGILSVTRGDTSRRGVHIMATSAASSNDKSQQQQHQQRRSSARPPSSSSSRCVSFASSPLQISELLPNASFLRRPSRALQLPVATIHSGLQFVPVDSASAILGASSVSSPTTDGTPQATKKKLVGLAVSLRVQYQNISIRQAGSLQRILLSHFQGVEDRWVARVCASVDGTAYVFLMPVGGGGGGDNDDGRMRSSNSQQQQQQQQLPLDSTHIILTAGHVLLRRMREGRLTAIAGFDVSRLAAVLQCSVPCAVKELDDDWQQQQQLQEEERHRQVQFGEKRDGKKKRRHHYHHRRRHQEEGEESPTSSQMPMVERAAAHLLRTVVTPPRQQHHHDGGGEKCHRRRVECVFVDFLPAG